MISNRFDITTIVHNKEIFFVHYRGAGEERILYQTSLDAFLDDGFDEQMLPQSVRGKENRLLIVPDFWIESTTYQFQSKKRPMVEAFVERKLQTEHPDLPHIQLFFTYTFSQKREKTNNIHVAYLEEPDSYRLFNKLNETGLAPQLITTSAFIWEARLAKLLADFGDIGVGFITTIEKNSYLYFYHNGRFLFSRDIVIPETVLEESEDFDALVFEVNQSIYLFSQKAKSDLKYLIAHDPDKAVAADLSERLGREVLDFRELEGSASHKREYLSELGPAGAFNTKDVSPKNDYLYVSHKIWQKARDWRPVQAMGIVVGLILFLILGVGYFFLFKMSLVEQIPMDQTGIIGGKAPKVILREYNDAVNYLLQEQQRLSTRNALIYLVKTLPENVELTDATVTVAPKSEVMLKCTVGVSDMNAFRYTLTKLMDNLGIYFKGIKQVKKQDVEIQAVDTTGESFQVYTIDLKFNLP